MEEHLGYGKSERSDNDDYRNGYKRKRVNSSYGAIEYTGALKAPVRCFGNQLSGKGKSSFRTDNVNITVRRSRQSGVARATCPD